MAKDKKKAKSGIPKTVPKQDEYERISYLYQLGMTSVKNLKLKMLSRGYNRNGNIISKKAVLRLSPHFKRASCKKCDTILVPGLTMSVELTNDSKDKNQKSDILVHKCENCEDIRRFPVGKDREYELFCDQNEVKN